MKWFSENEPTVVHCKMNKISSIERYFLTLNLYSIGKNRLQSKNEWILSLSISAKVSKTLGKFAYYHIAIIAVVWVGVSPQIISAWCFGMELRSEMEVNRRRFTRIHKPRTQLVWQTSWDLQNPHHQHNLVQLCNTLTFLKKCSKHTVSQRTSKLITWLFTRIQ